MPASTGFMNEEDLSVAKIVKTTKGFEPSDKLVRLDL
jgi:hypothetical protein